MSKPDMSVVDAPAPVESSTRRRSPARVTVSRLAAARKKKVWIDIDNSPHVPFFLPIIDELEKQGIELLLTARNIYQVRELLDFFHLPCKVIGRHYGKNKFLKILGTCIRAVELAPTGVVCALTWRFRTARGRN